MPRSRVRSPSSPHPILALAKSYGQRRQRDDTLGAGRVRPRSPSMRVEWQGDHKMLDESVKQDFELELERLGHDPSQYIVVIRREPDIAGSGGLPPLRYKVHITRLVGSDP